MYVYLSSCVYARHYIFVQHGIFIVEYLFAIRLLYSRTRMYVVNSCEANERTKTRRLYVFVCDELPNKPNEIFEEEGQAFHAVRQQKAPDCMHTTARNIIICSRFILIVARDFSTHSAKFSLVEKKYFSFVPCLLNITIYIYLFFFFYFTL